MNFLAGEGKEVVLVIVGRPSITVNFRTKKKFKKKLLSWVVGGEEMLATLPKASQSRYIRGLFKK